MKVLVLEGGISSERAVSLRSAKAVKAALAEAGHEVLSFDTKQQLDKLADYRGTVDVVFPVLHGIGGEDGTVQKVLETFGMAFVGAGSSVSQTCFNKQSFKERLAKKAIRTPGGVIVTRESVKRHPLLSAPFVLKPVTGGSSINTHIIREPANTLLDFDKIFSDDAEMLLEELIVGDEITVPIFGSKALPVIEIIPPAGAEFDYENKYNGLTQELCPPKNIPVATQLAAQQLAEDIHSSLGVRHLSRIDFIVINDGGIVTLELNTIPGLTEFSLFPKAAFSAGITMAALVDELVKQAQA